MHRIPKAVAVAEYAVAKHVSNSNELATHIIVRPVCRSGRLKTGLHKKLATAQRAFPTAQSHVSITSCRITSSSLSLPLKPSCFPLLARLPTILAPISPIAYVGWLHIRGRGSARTGCRFYYGTQILMPHTSQKAWRACHVQCHDEVLLSIFMDNKTPL